VDPGRAGAYQQLPVIRDRSRLCLQQDRDRRGVGEAQAAHVDQDASESQGLDPLKLVVERGPRCEVKFAMQHETKRLVLGPAHDCKPGVLGRLPASPRLSGWMVPWRPRHRGQDSTSRDETRIRMLNPQR
jgi:hypothetical protein